MINQIKTHPTIGCCGIDCGLCPRYCTKGDSACPGCGGANFREKHPSCGYLTCCVIKNGHEVCAECKDYPCKRFNAEKSGYDSFVTHRKMFENHDAIKANGIDTFISKQQARMYILQDLLTNYDDGRTKSFYCLSCGLLPIDKLQETINFAHNLNQEMDMKEKTKSIKNKMLEDAEKMKIELRLRK